MEERNQNIIYIYGYNGIKETKQYWIGFLVPNGFCLSIVNVCYVY